jgi:hypothetical protein
MAAWGFGQAHTHLLGRLWIADCGYAKAAPAHAFGRESLGLRYGASYCSDNTIGARALRLRIGTTQGQSAANDNHVSGWMLLRSLVARYPIAHRGLLRPRLSPWDPLYNIPNNNFQLRSRGLPLLCLFLFFRSQAPLPCS